MVILDPYGMNFDAVGVFSLAFYLLLKSCLSILCCPPHPTTNSKTTILNFFDQLKQVLFMYLLLALLLHNQSVWLKNSGFVVLKLVVRSDEQHKNFLTFPACF